MSTWPAESNISQRWWKECKVAAWSSPSGEVSRVSQLKSSSRLRTTAGRILLTMSLRRRGCYACYEGAPVAKKLELNGLNKGKRQRPLINETTGSAWAGFVKDSEGDIISGACFHVKDISSGQNISVCPHKASADLKPVEWFCFHLFDGVTDSRLLGRATNGHLLRLNSGEFRLYLTFRVDKRKRSCLVRKWCVSLTFPVTEARKKPVQYRCF